jgi:putative transposase
LKGRNRVKGHERILGDTDFVMEVLAEANETVNRRYKLRSLGYDVETVAQRVSEIYGIDPKELFPRRRQKIRVEARSLLCYWAVHELAVSLTDLARSLAMSPSAISYAIARGEKLAKSSKYQLIN